MGNTCPSMKLSMMVVELHLSLTEKNTMSTNDFQAWFDGFCEAKGYQLDAADIQTIKTKMASLFSVNVTTTTTWPEVKPFGVKDYTDNHSAYWEFRPSHSFGPSVSPVL